ncbi:MAG: hypothetical protein GXO97_09715 [Nitrospirae bacterium]|nr:hypothetical protein [Nitrospirota bacterium]
MAISAAPSVIAGAAVAAGSYGAATGMMFLAPVAAIAGPVYLPGRHYADQKDREAIEQEFNRRNLRSITLAGNASIQGSVFYPIIPNPRALVFTYRIGNKTKVLKVSLEKLKGLHVAEKKKEQGK